MMALVFFLFGTACGAAAAVLAVFRAAVRRKTAPRLPARHDFPGRQPAAAALPGGVRGTGYDAFS